MGEGRGEGWIRVGWGLRGTCGGGSGGNDPGTRDAWGQKPGRLEEEREELRAQWQDRRPDPSHLQANTPSVIDQHTGASKPWITTVGS